MGPQGLEWLGPLGAGPDGVSYRARPTGDGAREVEVRVLGPARSDPTRWGHLERRLRLASRVTHPGVLAILRLEWGGRDEPESTTLAEAPEQGTLAETVAEAADPPWLVVEWLDGPTLASRFQDARPVVPGHIAAIAATLAGAVAEAHRQGLAVGAIDPGFVRLDERERPKLDLTGTRTRPDAPAIPDNPDPADDVAAIGALIGWLAEGDNPGPLAAIVREALADDPADRPSAASLARRLEALAGTPFAEATVAQERVEAGVSDATQLLDHGMETVAREGASSPRGAIPGAGEVVGRYRLMEEVGRGGQGIVFRAEDTLDGSTVALKLLRPEAAARPEVLRRFRKEARMLAAVNNPRVVNLLGYHDEDGLAYLVMEYVTGPSLADRLAAAGKFPEAEALAIAADLARALADAHERGVVHRDIKPANVLMLERDDATGGPLLKLTDFGLARNLWDSESLAMTAPGALLGTPQYMAPEQFAARPVDPTADVYALGVTLYHMIAGRPPFLADTMQGLATQHTHEPPPPPERFGAGASEGLNRLLTRMLAKAPAERPSDAGTLLEEIERLRRGEPSPEVQHPILPPHDPADVLDYDFTWDLRSSPEALWPHISNTERLNRAIGLPPPRYASRIDEAGEIRRDGCGSRLGLAFQWREHPYEWVEPGRFSILRVFETGPFLWMSSRVDLRPRPDGGTALRHHFQVLPRNAIGRAAAALEVGVKARRSLDRVYRRIDASLIARASDATERDPFEPSPALPAARRSRLASRLDALAARGADPAALGKLGGWLAEAPAQEVARLRPLAMARRWGLDPEVVTSACLLAAIEALLVPLWDVICPSCRLPAEVHDTLRAVREHGSCEGCQREFANDFGGSIELIFRAHPEIREADLGRYCAGSPAHSPHVPAQVRLAPGARVELSLALPEGVYRLRGPQLPWAVEFEVRRPPAPRRWDVVIATGVPPEAPDSLQAGGQRLHLTNTTSIELLVRIERRAERDDVLTAARASALPLFRELFPGEVLAPGRLATVAALTVLAAAPDPADVDALATVKGDGFSVGAVIDLLHSLDAAVRRGNGTTVKTTGEGLLAVFAEPSDAVRTAVELIAFAARPGAGRLRPRLAVDRGPVVTATFADRPDYFGATVRCVGELLGRVAPGEAAITLTLASDPQVNVMLGEKGARTDLLPAAEGDGSPRAVMRVRPRL